jgi:hypothetical protein
MKPIPEAREKQKTKPLSERVKDVAEVLPTLSWMPNYPKEEDHFTFFCRALAKFVQTQDRCHWSNEDPEWNEKFALGWVNPLQWLVEKVGETCEFFPPPIKWRTIYCEFFPPLDHQSPNDLYEIAGE